MTIDPNAVYTEGAVSLALGVSLAAIARARRDGTLKSVRRGNRVLILGRNLLAWLDPGPGGAARAERELAHA